MKIIFGAYQADSGIILIDGRQTQFTSPRDAMQNGIGMVFQEQSLIGNLSVMENIFLGRESEFKRFGIINFKEMEAAAKYQLAKVGLEIDPRSQTFDLSFAQRQLVELAKVLTLEERTQNDLVILLDEPTSVLAEDEVKLLFKLVNQLRDRAAFIFVSHRLDEVITLSDRIYVLKDGEVVDEVDANLAKPENIQSAMVGREIDSGYYKQDERKDFDASAVILNVENVSVRSKLENINLKLRKSEVLCLVGTEDRVVKPYCGQSLEWKHQMQGYISYFDDDLYL